MTGAHWVIRDGVSGVTLAELHGPSFNKGTALKVARDIATAIGASVTAPSYRTTPLRNPTLVHHGAARAARWHVLTATEHAPVADLYGVEPETAAKIVSDLATRTTVPMLLMSNRGLPRSIGEHSLVREASGSQVHRPRRLNPKRKGRNPRHGEPTRVRQRGTRVTAASSPEERIAAIRRIVEEKQYAKVDGTMIDLFSASAIVAVYDALNAENRVKFASFPAGKMGIIAFKLLKPKTNPRGAFAFRQGWRRAWAACLSGRGAARQNPSSNGRSGQLYDAALAAGIPIDHHESDLYLLATPAARELVKSYGAKATAFRSDVDGKTWLEIPFAYAPFWRAKGKPKANPGGRKTLREWSEQYGIDMRQKGGAYWIPDTFTNEATRAELWRLSDYAVSSVSGGTIWLVKRATPNRRGREYGPKMTRRVRRAVASGRFPKAQHLAAASTARGVRRLDLQRRRTFPVGRTNLRMSPAEATARAAAWDAGNRHAKAHGRKKWNRDDYNAAVRELDRLLGPYPNPKGRGRLPAGFKVGQVWELPGVAGSAPTRWRIAGHGDDGWLMVDDLYHPGRHPRLQQMHPSRFRDGRIVGQGPRSQYAPWSGGAPFSNPKGRKTISNPSRRDAETVAERLWGTKREPRFGGYGAAINGLGGEVMMGVVRVSDGKWAGYYRGKSWGPVINRAMKNSPYDGHENPSRKRHPKGPTVRTAGVRGRHRSNPRESEVALARRTFRRLNEIEPGTVTRVKTTRGAPPVLAKLGDIVEIVYDSDKYAGSPHNPKGKVLRYSHTTKRPRPILATDPSGTEVHVVGGRMRPTPDGLVN